MNRSNPVLVYKDKINHLHCRIGIIGTNNTCGDICSLLIQRHSHTCHVFGGGTEGTWTEGFHFDNREHTIVLSTNKCILCSNNCVDGISRCRYNIKKYIDIFVDKIDKVEAR